jgi:hypothetical protein
LTVIRDCHRLTVDSYTAQGHVDNSRSTSYHKAKGNFCRDNAGKCQFLDMLPIVYSASILGISPFKTAPFPVVWWIPLVLVSLLGFFVIELEKLLA